MESSVRERVLEMCRHLDVDITSGATPVVQVPLPLLEKLVDIAARLVCVGDILTKEFD